MHAASIDLEEKDIQIKEMMQLLQDLDEPVLHSKEYNIMNNMSQNQQPMVI